METRSLLSSIAVASYQQTAGQIPPRAITATGGSYSSLSSSQGEVFTLASNVQSPTYSLESIGLRPTQVVDGTAAVSKPDSLKNASQPPSITSPNAATSTELQTEAQTEELEVIRELADRDREVRAHEAAHAAAGGAHTGAPNYTYERGPDGKLYAVEGSIPVDTSEIPNDPEATIAKAESIIRAALAPANPSPEDIKVAAEAQALLTNAQAELSVSANEENQPAKESSASSSDEEQRLDSEKEQPLFEPKTLDKEKLSDNSQAIEDRLQRSREQQQLFATQLQELNRKVGAVLERLIETGATDGIEPQGTFIDYKV